MPGQTTSEILKQLKHPVTDVPGPDSLRKTVWAPPGKGFVKAGTLVFEVLDSLICDPIWDDKFYYLTDGRMTFVNESFFHVLRNSGTKHSHFHRFYSIAMWCSVLSWNENCGRPILEYVWRCSKSGQLKGSAGRKYKVPIRVPQTAFWRVLCAAPPPRLPDLPRPHSKCTFSPALTTSIVGGVGGLQSMGARTRRDALGSTNN